MEIIIKPTEACNGTCVYCSADGTLGKRKILPQDRLGRLFDIFAEWMRAGERRGLRFLWHGGGKRLIKAHGGVLTDGDRQSSACRQIVTILESVVHVRSRLARHRPAR